jgi:hypothetical protein
MDNKVFVRKVERYTVWLATEPIEVDVEKLRKCDPPYEGDTHEELLEYLADNVWGNYDWSEENTEVYGEKAYDLTFDESMYNEPYSDSRDKYEDSWIEVGVPNEEYRKTGLYESFADNMSKNY